jgi:hypothetical protein
MADMVPSREKAGFERLGSIPGAAIQVFHPWPSFD